ncbi:MAG TPA: MFS transporter [Candidatus Limnocylindria bacterium]
MFRKPEGGERRATSDGAEARLGRTPSTWFGATLLIGLLTGGYVYNLTLIQLGLPDFGTRVLGLPRADVAWMMAGLAVVTALTAVAVAGAMLRSGRTSFRAKLRIASVSAAGQVVLTMVLGLVGDAVGLWAWMLVAGALLGAGIPAAFGLVVDLVPVRWRGYVAAAATAIAYALAATLSGEWRAESFVALLLPPMGVGAAILLVFAFWRMPFADVLGSHQRDARYGVGRYAGAGGQLVPALIALFVIFFIDSFGFLRLVETPAYLNAAWQSGETGDRVLIAGAHVLGALVAGVLYTHLGHRSLLGWIFGIFALVHLMYLFDVRLMGGGSQALAMPALYALGVSLYTVVNFAIWADLSNARTVVMLSAIGVAASAWTATFLSTALAITWNQTRPLEEHLEWVAALALVGLLIVAVVQVYGRRRPESRVRAS